MILKISFPGISQPTSLWQKKFSKHLSAQSRRQMGPNENAAKQCQNPTGVLPNQGLLLFQAPVNCLGYLQRFAGNSAVRLSNFLAQLQTR